MTFKEVILQLFCDDKGTPSMMRLMTFGSFVVGIIRIFYNDFPGASLLLGFSFSGKIGQKIVER